MLQPVILSGGSGTRLWPLSRELFPKQLINLQGGSETLLQATIVRTIGLPNLTSALIVCNEAHRFLVAEQVRAMGQTARVVLEPIAKNTAPAIALVRLLRSRARCCSCCLPTMSFGMRKPFRRPSRRLARSLSKAHSSPSVWSPTRPRRAMGTFVAARR